MDFVVVEVVGMIFLMLILVCIDCVIMILEFMILLGQYYCEFFGVLFYFVEELDFVDFICYVLWMGQVGLGLFDEVYYCDDDKVEVCEVYVSYVIWMFILVGLDNVVDQVQVVMDLEIEIVFYYWDQVYC